MYPDATLIIFIIEFLLFNLGISDNAVCKLQTKTGNGDHLKAALFE
jgi:hypothetical protein